MTVQKLEEDRWGPYLNQFSKELPVQLAEVTVEALNLGSQLEAEWIRIFSVNYDHRDDIIIVSLDGLEHMIHKPNTIFIDELNGHVTSLEIIDMAGIRHLVQLRQPIAQSVSAKTTDIVDEAGDESFPASDPPSWAGA